MTDTTPAKPAAKKPAAEAPKPAPPPAPEPPLDYRLDAFRPIPPFHARDRTLNIAQRMNLVQTEVNYVQKEKKADMKYSIVSHDAVTASVRPPMQAAGILYYPLEMTTVQVGNRTEISAGIVRFENIDDRSDFIDVATAGYGIDQQDKGPGKALSYAVKYALLKVLGLETGDDPDLDQRTAAKHPFEFKADAFMRELPDCATLDDVTAAWEKFKPDWESAPEHLADAAKLARRAYAARYRALGGTSGSAPAPQTNAAD